MQYAEHFESYLRGLMQKYPHDVDMVSALSTVVHKIKHENYKPIVELKLCPIYGCYLIDCLFHNF